MPKTFLAINLSDAFTFDDNERAALEEGLEMKSSAPTEQTSEADQVDNLPVEPLTSEAEVTGVAGTGA